MNRIKLLQNYPIAIGLFAYSGFNFLSNLVSRIFLSKDHYGLLGVILAYSALSQAIGFFGTNQLADKEYHSGTHFGGYLNNVLRIWIILLPIQILVLTFFISNATLIFLVIVHSAFFVFNAILRNYYTASGKSSSLAVVLLLASIGGFLITYISLYLLKSYLIRITTLLLVEAVILFLLIKKSEGFYWNISFKIKEILLTFRKSFLLAINALTLYFFMSYDRIFASKLFGYGDSGDYWFALQLSIPITLIGQVLVRKYIKELYNVSKIKRPAKYLIALFIIVLVGEIFLFNKSIELNLYVMAITGTTINVIYLFLNHILISKDSGISLLVVSVTVLIFQLVLYNFTSFTSIFVFAWIFLILNTSRVLLSLILILYKYENSNNHWHCWPRRGLSG